MSQTKRCVDCRLGEYADTLQCELCWEDVCKKEKCSNASGYTCEECHTTWCDDCLEEVVCCQFCECCAVCDPAIFPCNGCEDDMEVMEDSIPFYACTKCRLEMCWTMSVKANTGEVIVCCPVHPQGSPFVHDPIAETEFQPLKLPDALMV